MAKFVSKRDFDFFQHINRELSVDIIDVLIVLYKMNVDHTDTNIYGEATEKVYNTGIEIPAFINYGTNINIIENGFGIDQHHEVQYNFVRRILEERDVYPEIGDIIYYNDAYFEIDNTSEVQLIASRPDYNHSIICLTHMTRRSDIQLEERQL